MFPKVPLAASSCGGTSGAPRGEEEGFQLFRMRRTKCIGEGSDRQFVLVRGLGCVQWNKRACAHMLEGTHTHCTSECSNILSQ